MYQHKYDKDFQKICESVNDMLTESEGKKVLDNLSKFNNKLKHLNAWIASDPLKELFMAEHQIGKLIKEDPDNKDLKDLKVLISARFKELVDIQDMASSKKMDFANDLYKHAKRRIK